MLTCLNMKKDLHWFHLNINTGTTFYCLNKYRYSDACEETGFITTPLSCTLKYAQL